MPAIATNLRQIASFLVIGVLATVAHYTVLISLVQLAHEPPVPATLLGFCAGGAVSYRLNRRHTFKSEKRHREAIWRFAVVAGIGFLATALLMSLAVDIGHLPYLSAQVVVTGIVMVWNYAASRWWTFADRERRVDGCRTPGTSANQAGRLTPPLP